MKLVTFQSIDAIKDLFSKGYLECKESKLDLKKNGYAYSWIVEKMNNYVSNEHNVLYPIWCWVKCYNSIAPAKRKGDKVVNYDQNKINELLNNKEIIRNKLKINASINNSRIFKEIF